jgi:hypothetical protein
VPTKIVTAGRRDGLEDYFKGEVLAWKKLTHTPLLAFVDDGDSITVKVIDKPGDVSGLPDDTPMMGQWRGQYCSDYFQFTAGVLKHYVQTHPDHVRYKDQW